MPTLIIDDKEIRVKPGATIMEAAKLLGIKIPHFCYHGKLSVAGNCRMCMVEVEKMPKPVISCAMPVNEGMVVRTNSEMVQKARRGVMEFLLINHPLDCPVCDQGGECKLQDYAMQYGPDHSRFTDEKRKVPNYDLGPLIETEMNRCIHCTRCIRFSTEIAGVEEMGAVFRGDHMKVGPYLKNLTLSSELSGNMAEICPVGALNLKPFHFQARGWELKHADGVCVHCAVGCRTRVDHLDNRVLRVKARKCDALNQGWLCDKGRFAFDGMTVERLEAPMIRDGQSVGVQTEVTWAQAMDRAAEILKGVRPEEVAGLADSSGRGAEELFAFQDFLRGAVGTAHLDHRVRQRDYSADQAPLTRADLMMNTSLAMLEGADRIFLVGANPRFELPLLNLRLRKATLEGAGVWSIFPRWLKSNLENHHQFVIPPGEEVDFLQKVLAGLDGKRGTKGPSAWVKALKEAEKPALLIGNYALLHPQAETIRRLCVAILDKIGALSEQWNGFNRLASCGNAAAAQDMGVVPHRGPGYRHLEQMGKNASQILAGAASGEIKVLFLLGLDPSVDAMDTTLARAALSKAQVIYLGAYRSCAALGADVVLPGLLHSEKESTVTNCEGRVQHSHRAVNGPLKAKEDWRILRALSDRFSQPLPYNTLEALRGAMGQADRHYDLSTLEDWEVSPACDHSPVTVGLTPEAIAPVDPPAQGALTLIMEPSFYRDGPVTRRSVTMGKLDQGHRLRIGQKDAGRLDIVSGSRVRILHEERSLEMEVQVDDGVGEGVVFGKLGQSPQILQDLCDWGGGFPRVSLVKV